jgi:hypothetical protein
MFSLPPPRHISTLPGSDRAGPTGATVALVESKMGAVAWGLWPTPRFPSPLIEPDVPISAIRLTDWFHRKAHVGPISRSRRRSLLEMAVSWAKLAEEAGYAPSGNAGGSTRRVGLH